MTHEEIIKNLKETYQSETTIDILAKFIEEFSNLLGVYISDIEIIDQIKRNIKRDFNVSNNLINGKIDGQYDNMNKTLNIYKGSMQDIDYFSYLMFHELTHAVTFKELPNNNQIMGFSHLNDPHGLGAGLNEAMTEWLSQKRNKMVNYENEASGYDVVVEQINILSQIIGEEKLIKCFLYEPENLSKLLTENNIDYKRLDFLYRVLIAERKDIYALANKKELNNIVNYNLYKECDELFSIYCGAINEVKTIEDFKRKYRILCSYKDSIFNINNIISLKFYTEIYNDVMMLMKKGVSPKELTDIVNSFGISIPKIYQAKEYSEILLKDKDEAIIGLYEMGSKDIHDFENFFLDNYGLIYDKFSEDNFIPSKECLYDINRYMLIGKFLKEKKEYYYDEISTQRVQLSNGIYVYIIGPYKMEKSIYTIPPMRITSSNDKIELITKENEIIQLHLSNSGISIKSENSNIGIAGVYYKESQLESFEYQINSNNGNLSEEKRNYYKKKYETIEKKRKQRKLKSDGR